MEKRPLWAPEALPWATGALKASPLRFVVLEALLAAAPSAGLASLSAVPAEAAAAESSVVTGRERPPA